MDRQTDMRYEGRIGDGVSDKRAAGTCLGEPFLNTPQGHLPDQGPQTRSHHTPYQIPPPNKEGPNGSQGGPSQGPSCVLLGEAHAPSAHHPAPKSPSACTKGGEGLQGLPRGLVPAILAPLQLCTLDGQPAESRALASPPGASGRGGAGLARQRGPRCPLLATLSLSLLCSGPLGQWAGPAPDSECGRCEWVTFG